MDSHVQGHGPFATCHSMMHGLHLASVSLGLAMCRPQEEGRGRLRQPAAIPFRQESRACRPEPLANRMQNYCINCINCEVPPGRSVCCARRNHEDERASLQSGPCIWHAAGVWKIGIGGRNERHSSGEAAMCNARPSQHSCWPPSVATGRGRPPRGSRSTSQQRALSGGGCPSEPVQHNDGRQRLHRCRGRRPPHNLYATEFASSSALAGKRSSLFETG